LPTVYSLKKKILFLAIAVEPNAESLVKIFMAECFEHLVKQKFENENDETKTCKTQYHVLSEKLAANKDLS
jgi:hypothetical protein